MKVFYYAKRFGYNALPSLYFKRKYQKLKRFEKSFSQEEIEYRINYYNKVNQPFETSKRATSIENYKRTKGTDYFLDLKEFLHYFKLSTRFDYRFGDDTDVNSFPTLVKARPIDGNNANSVLFKLNKNRHFNWVNDNLKFTDKKDLMVWRGGAYLELRKSFVKKFYNHPLCNVKQTNRPVEDLPWQGDFLSIQEQLKYKFIFCPEGNDVATNLKWVMSSNSLCLMPKPKYETWFMEGTLKAGVHYVEVKSDYSDLEEKILYYSKNSAEAEQIISNAHAHVNRFKNENLEDLLCLKVLEKYTKLSGQFEALKFNDPTA
ncbi:glycosyl transferase family 90 [Brumimicrobium aurantiacum]|uniref:Lipopolysaccharide A protein n=1 Tax=Brumimicrobium aurantiacum TaxID=1737063 RepID=A0A3E1F236_9FLAO|nr:glycosyl transferase family 90 [Brumimicrobium aurantiacum]RFC55888.1 lipopolysaccharide A protein [Brumimicrobium aurantiacum]